MPKQNIHTKLSVKDCNACSIHTLILIYPHNTFGKVIDFFSSGNQWGSTSFSAMTTHAIGPLDFSLNVCSAISETSKDNFLNTLGLYMLLNLASVTVTAAVHVIIWFSFYIIFISPVNNKNMFIVITGIALKWTHLPVGNCVVIYSHLRIHMLQVPAEAPAFEPLPQGHPLWHIPKIHPWVLLGEQTGGPEFYFSHHDTHKTGKWEVSHSRTWRPEEPTRGEERGAGRMGREKYSSFRTGNQCVSHWGLLLFFH